MITVKTNYKFNIKTDGSWCDVIKEFHDILVVSDGDVELGDTDSLCVTTVQGWNMLKMARFIDYLSDYGYGVDYVKSRVRDYSELKYFMNDLDDIFNDSLEKVRNKFRVGQEEMEQ